MKKILILILLSIITVFEVKAQNLYQISVLGSNNITMHVTVLTTGVALTPYGGSPGGTCGVKLIFDSSVKFSKNGIELQPGSSLIPPIYTVLGYFKCTSDPSVYFDIPNQVGYFSGNSVNLTDPTPLCNGVTINSLNCNAIEFLVEFPGVSRRQVVQGTSTLPIELITFDAFKKDRQVELAWKTASELNNDYFTIERSVDGMSWENIQTVRGAGNSSQVIDYSWIDYSSYAGVSYYRLSQTDYDGTMEIFNIVSVQQNDVEELQAYPNPVSHTSTLLGVDQTQVLKLFNTIGVEVTGNVAVSASPSGKTFLDMSQLPKGMYYVTNGGQRIQILKQ